MSLLINLSTEEHNFKYSLQLGVFSSLKNMVRTHLFQLPFCKFILLDQSMTFPFYVVRLFL